MAGMEGGGGGGGGFGGDFEFGVDPTGEIVLACRINCSVDVSGFCALPGIIKLTNPYQTRVCSQLIPSWPWRCEYRWKSSVTDRKKRRSGLNLPLPRRSPSPKTTRKVREESVRSLVKHASV